MFGNFFSFISACVVLIALVFAICIFPEVKKRVQNERKFKQMRSEYEIIKAENNMLKAENDVVKSLESNLTAIPYLAGIMADFQLRNISIFTTPQAWQYDKRRYDKSLSVNAIKDEASQIVQENKIAQYKLDYALMLFPDLDKFFTMDYKVLSLDHNNDYQDLMLRYIRNNVDEIQLFRTRNQIAKLITPLEKQFEDLEILKSNITALPYMAGVIADFETRGIEALAVSLDWGKSQERLKKVQSIREIRRKTKELIAQYKTAQYQLEYAIRMFPALADFLDTDYGEIAELNLADISSEEHDIVRDYISKEEYAKLSTVGRNQLALDRYRESHRKSKWQIGRDYELYIGYRYEQKGYTVNYCGSQDKLEDLGRDLIATKEGRTLIIQCKYWSTKKLIHEKHINQLYGTMICYCFENNLPVDSVRGILVTNITASDTAKKFAEYLGIEIAEKIPLGEYPCIKCNINHSHEEGTTRIYHLPFDQMYDACQINNPGEFMAMTVAEAEAAGFRRAYRWHGEK